MQIINTSSGPAILDDQGNVIMPGDFDGMTRVLHDSPETVTQLVTVLEEKVQASDPIIAKVKALTALTDEETKALYMAQTCHMNIYNVANVVNANQEVHSHE